MKNSIKDQIKNLNHTDIMWLEVLLDDNKYDAPKWKTSTIVEKIQWLESEYAGATTALEYFENRLRSDDSVDRP